MLEIQLETEAPIVAGQMNYYYHYYDVTIIITIITIYYYYMDSATGFGPTALAGVNTAYVILLLLLLWPMITLMSSSRLSVGPVGYDCIVIVSFGGARRLYMYIMIL